MKSKYIFFLTIVLVVCLFSVGCQNLTYYISPIFRIEVNLPSSKTVNGFVFESNFLSENLTEEVETDIFSTFLVETEEMSFPKSCDLKSKQAFDQQVVQFIERLQNKVLDIETQSNFDNLRQLAESIILK